MTFVTAKNWREARDELAQVFTDQELPAVAAKLAAISPDQSGESDALLARKVRVLVKKKVSDLGCTQDIGLNASCGDQASAWRDLQPLCEKHAAAFDTAIYLSELLESQPVEVEDASEPAPADAALGELGSAVAADDKPRRNAALAAALDAGNDLTVVAAVAGLSPESVKTYARAARKLVAA